MASESLVPLESNPEVMNKFLRKLGVAGDCGIVDIMGLDPEMLAWVPRPVYAVILLFPLSESYNNHKEKEESDILSKGQTISPNIFYMKQNLSNSCGTVALMHSVLNNISKVKLTNDVLKQFLEDAKGLDAAARGKLMESHSLIIGAHKELAQEGQTSTPGAEDPINHHFIAFVHKDGNLYELDGRKAFPVNHGPTTEDALLNDAAKICQQFMARDPDEVRFTVVALAATDE